MGKNGIAWRIQRSPPTKFTEKESSPLIDAINKIPKKKNQKNRLINNEKHLH